MKKVITSIVILSFIFGFSNFSEAENNKLYLGNDNVYYICQGKPVSPQNDDNGENDSMSFDLGSIKILNDTFFTDKNGVYFISTFNYYCYFFELQNVDSVTFQVLNDNYEKDKNAVYYNNSSQHGWPNMEKIENADIETFEVFYEDANYAMDKNNIYYKGNPIGEQSIKITNNNLYNKLEGKIILKVETNGEAYYISPNKKEMYFLSRPVIAFHVMREQGIGITNEDLEKIPVADNCPSYTPGCDNVSAHDFNFAKAQKGKIFLQVEENGEAWYVNPDNYKRYFLGRPTDAFNVMKNLGLGISNNNFNSLTK